MCYINSIMCYLNCIMCYLVLMFVSGKRMHIVEAKNGNLIYTADDYTPPPNDNDEEPNRRVDLIEVNGWQ